MEAAISQWINNTTMDYERRANMRAFTPPPLGTEGKTKLTKPLPNE